MTRRRRQPLQLRPDRVDNAAQVAKHFRTGNTQHAIALGIEPAIALGIVRHLRILRVMSTVDLDDQSLLQTHEIRDIPAYRMLATEAQTIHLPGAQSAPQLAPSQLRCNSAAVLS